MSANESPNPGIEPEILINGLKEKPIYSEMLQTKVPADEDVNSELIKKLLGIYYVINPIMNYVKGNYSKQTALDLFKSEAGSMLDRFSGIKNFTEKLFVELANILKSLGKVQTQTSTKAEKVMERKDESDECAKIQVGQTIKLNKEKPLSIVECHQLKIEIERDEEAKKHILHIERNDDKLAVWCSTADFEEGKKLILEIEQGAEYSIGQADTRLLNLTKAKLEKAIAVRNAARSEFNKHNRVSSVSEETRLAEEKVKRAQSQVEIIKLAIKKLESDPRLKWFDQEQSSDISADHIIIEYTDCGIVVVTDEGEKGKANLTRVA
jgi:hypothetical protein